jgi:predicted NBD/HSP70 family sugar kinase
MNRMALVRMLCREPALSRADLAVRLGLTKSTVGMLVRELVEEGWLNEAEIVTTGSLGRRPTPLHVDGSRLALLGIDVGIDEARLVATSLTGETLATSRLKYTAAENAAACLAAVGAAALSLAQDPALGARRMLGVGVGLHGGVDEAQRLLHFAPNLGWRQVPVGQLLAAAWQGSPLAELPLFVQNEADMAVLAEYEFGPAAESASGPLVYLSIGWGVGAGVVVRDTLLTGARGFAGEVGHMVLQSRGPLCSCGRRGCAEALIGFRSLLGRDQSLVDLTEAVAISEPNALWRLQEAGRHLGVLLNNLWVAFDPARIIVGGPAVSLGPSLLELAQQVLRANASAAQLTAPSVQASSLGADAVATGAAAYVRYHLTRPMAQAFEPGRHVAMSPSPLPSPTLLTA